MKHKSIVFSVLAIVMTVCMLCSCTGSNGIKDVYNSANYITPGQYKEIEVTLSQNETVTDDDVETAKYNLLVQNAISSTEKVDGVAEKWNNVEFNYTAYLVETEEQLEQSSSYATIGSGNFLPGFEDQLLGVKKGDTKSITITYPTTSSSTISGKDIRFDIEVTGVFVYEFPEFNDDFVFTNFGYNTVDEFYTKYKVALQEQRTTEIKQEKANSAWTIALENATVKKYPTETHESYISDAASYYKQYATNNGQSVVESDMNAYATEQAEALLKEELLAYCIIAKENLTITDEQKAAYCEALVQANGYDSVEAFESTASTTLAESYGEGNLEKFYIVQRAMEFCGETAKVVEAK